MPLVTDNLDQARVAYDALEERALSGERHTQALQARVAELLGRRPPFEDTAVLRNRIVQLEAERQPGTDPVATSQATFPLV